MVTVTQNEPSLLEQFAKLVKVDADTYDADFIKTLPITPVDATSNQGFIHAALIDERNKDIVESTVKELKGQSWEEVYAVCVARIAKKVIPLISGRVLAQTSTSHAYDKDYIVEHARKYARAYNAEGITNDRFTIKIPVTSAGIAAAQVLKEEGIATLGTALFSVHQALAASQAGMIAISMYLNEPKAHAEVGVWPDVADPAVEAPMAPRHMQIRAAYDRLAAEGKPQPSMKTASFCVPADALACADLGADHATIGIPILTDLKDFSTVPEYRPGMWHVPFSKQAEDKTRTWGPWKPSKPSDARMQALIESDPLSSAPAGEWKVASTDVDYTADGVVDKLNTEDEATRRRLEAALERFTVAENLSKKFIEDLQASL